MERLRRPRQPVRADQAAAATVRLWPTAYRFTVGHRIRVQVASGSFPRYARNPGTGEPRATATRLVPADQFVYHDADYPSAITLPVRMVGGPTTAGPHSTAGLVGSPG